jgi:hypothetical protein
MRRPVTRAAALIVAGVLVMWAEELWEPPARGSACWGCPAVLEELVVAPASAETPAALDDPQAPERTLACKGASRRGEPRVTVFYDGSENPIRVETDVNRDGRADEWEHLAGEGNVPVRIERDCNGDGRVDRRQTFDPAGKPLGYEIDADFDGAMEVIFP